jgi:hypothetical protein
MALRRVVGRRVKELKEIYELRKLPTGVKPKYDLELLEYFGIIRPFMLKRLIDLRDSFEHEDSSPPPTDECLMFADLAWYFLRSTDVLVTSMVFEVEFSKPGMELDGRGTPRIYIEFYHSYNHEPLDIDASIDKDSFAREPRVDWVKVDATIVDEYEQLVYREDDGEDRIPWVRIDGKVSGTDEQTKLLYELYFRTNHM